MLYTGYLYIDDQLVDTLSVPEITDYRTAYRFYFSYFSSCWLWCDHCTIKVVACLG